MDDRFFNGIIGCQSKVCGVKLADLSSWHVLILHALKSPIMEQGRNITKGDLLQFLHVLRVQHPAIPTMKPSIRDIYWMARLGNKSLLISEVAKLKAWLTVQTSAPKFFQAIDSSNTGRALTSPSIFALVASLASKLGQLPSDIWNMRLAESRWLDATIAELNGAELNISYDGDSVELPQLKGEEAVEFARKTLPRKIFNNWLKERKKNAII